MSFGSQPSAISNRRSASEFPSTPVTNQIRTCDKSHDYEQDRDREVAPTAKSQDLGIPPT